MPRFCMSGPALLWRGAAVSLMIWASGTALAQQAATELSVVEPPRGTAGESYSRAISGRRIQSEALYSDETDPAFFVNGDTAIRPTSQPREMPQLRGGTGVFIVIALIVVMLLLWLRFGGTGALLSAAPKEADGATTAPEAWKIGADEAAMDSLSLLDQIRAMPDRRAALVRLLRHALLAAGSDSQTRFARSDTEREAFARLPASWRHRQLLGLLLKATELAHYGGRTVSEDAFEQALDQGAMILSRQRPSHA